MASDPLGQIGSLGARAAQTPQFGLTGNAQQRQLENRLQNVRPTDLTRSQEAAHEPKTTDEVDIPFEPELVSEGHEVEGHEADGAQAEAHNEASGQPLDGKPPDMHEELDRVRRDFAPTLAGTPTSLMGSRNASGILNPNDTGSGNTLFGSIREGLSSIRDRLFSPGPTSGLGSPFAVSAPFSYAGSPAGGPYGIPTDGAAFCGPQPPQSGMSRGMKWAMAAMIGTTALSAFAPFMFGMPMMSGFGMGGFGMGGLGMGLLGMTSMMVPMMAMMSTQMMMAQNCMPPPMMGAMPYAMGSMPYPPPMQNPYCAPPQQGQYPQGPVPYGPPPTWNPPTPMAGFPPQSQLVKGALVDLTDQQKATLASLPPERQQNFVQLWQNFQGAELTLPGRSDRVNVNAALARILDDGRAGVADRNGNDLLTNLTRMSTQETAPGLDRGLLTAQAIAHTAYPEHTISSAPHAPEAGTVEYSLARKNPAEYVRLASGLASPAGRVDLASGQVIGRVPDSVYEDGTLRTGLNRMMQSSLDVVARGSAPTQPAYADPNWSPFRGATPSPAVVSEPVTSPPAPTHQPAPPRPGAV